MGKRQAKKKDNKALKGALPDNYFSRLGLDTSRLAALISEIDSIDTLKDKGQDVIGRIYEYFPGKFAIAVYTLKSIVNLIAQMMEPYKGIIYDPCCGSGGMFVQSVKFIEAHHGNRKEVSIYGQEYTNTTYKPGFFCFHSGNLKSQSGSNKKILYANFKN